MSDATISNQPTAAGMYDFYLGGSSHSPADRAAAEQMTQLLPDIANAALANRGFLQRAVARMATEWGVRQFLDLGSGLPTQRNTHDILAEATPDGRVLYADIDPVVVARAQEILAGVDGVSVIQGDVRAPEAIVNHPATRQLIDFTAPVGVMMVALLHFVPDDDDPWGLVRRYLDAVPAGSYLALSHVSVGDLVSDQTRDVATRIYASTATPPTDRSRPDIERFFAGLEIMPPYQNADPGIVHVGRWGVDDPALDSWGARLGYAAVARKP